jgi:hypothetical protein
MPEDIDASGKLRSLNVLPRIPEQFLNKADSNGERALSWH